MYSLGPKKKSLAIHTLSGRSGRKNWITIEKQFISFTILNQFTNATNQLHFFLLLFLTFTLLSSTFLIYFKFSSLVHIFDPFFPLYSYLFLALHYTFLQFFTVFTFLHFFPVFRKLKHVQLPTVQHLELPWPGWKASIFTCLFFLHSVLSISIPCSLLILSSVFFLFYLFFFNSSSPFCSLSLSTSVSSNNFSLFSS